MWVKTTFKHKRAELDNHVLPWIGNLKMEDIRPRDILIICQRIENLGFIEQAHRVKMICSQIFCFAVANSIVAQDITRDLKGALTPVSTTHRPCLKEPKQVGALLRAIDAHTGTFIVQSALKLSPLIFLRPIELREYCKVCNITLEFFSKRLEIKLSNKNL